MWIFPENVLVFSANYQTIFPLCLTQMFLHLKHICEIAMNELTFVFNVFIYKQRGL